MKTFPILITLLFAAVVTGCATSSEQQIQADVRPLSTNELLDRRAEINRKIRDDDFGAYIGITRWITHANQKDAALKERAAIDAELERRHVRPHDLAATESHRARPRAEMLLKRFHPVNST